MSYIGSGDLGHKHDQVCFNLMPNIGPGSDFPPDDYLLGYFCRRGRHRHDHRKTTTTLSRPHTKLEQTHLRRPNTTKSENDVSLGISNPIMSRSLGSIDDEDVLVKMSTCILPQNEMMVF